MDEPFEHSNGSTDIQTELA